MPRLLSRLLVPFTVLMVGLGLWQVGGPEQARIEQRDSQRMRDLQDLAAYLTCENGRKDGADYPCGQRPRDTDRFTQAPFTVTRTQVCAQFEDPDHIARRYSERLQNGCLQLN
ncbi:MAG: hypothetical protein GVY34_09670 [Alphaproteobacteria bacterium]|jgi:hypothetical protein|nr:hypothetical protein [Alphaproteobacteria bacterium]